MSPGRIGRIVYPNRAEHRAALDRVAQNPIAASAQGLPSVPPLSFTADELFAMASALPCNPPPAPWNTLPIEEVDARTPWMTGTASVRQLPSFVVLARPTASGSTWDEYRGWKLVIIRPMPDGTVTEQVLCFAKNGHRVKFKTCGEAERVGDDILAANANANPPPKYQWSTRG